MARLLPFQLASSVRTPLSFGASHWARLAQLTRPPTAPFAGPLLPSLEQDGFVAGQQLPPGLVRLQAPFNALTGAFPSPAWLDRAPALEAVDLSHNNLTEARRRHRSTALKRRGAAVGGSRLTLVALAASAHADAASHAPLLPPVPQMPSGFLTTATLPPLVSLAAGNNQMRVRRASAS